MLLRLSIALTLALFMGSLCAIPMGAQEQEPAASSTVAAPIAGEKAAANGGQRWAVLIGVDDYQWARKLRFCGADVNGLAEQLVAAGFPKDQVYLLHDKVAESRYRPLKNNIDESFRLVLGLVEPNDLLVVAFSGHGVHLDGKSYLCPQDAKLDDPQTLVSVDGVYEMLEKCPASLKLLIVDACRNDPRPATGRSLTPEDAKAFVGEFASSLEAPPHGILQLTSCAPGEIAQEDEELKHGVFMHFVLSGLTGQADADGNGRVSLTELYKFANVKTKNHVARKFFGSQRPGLKGDLYDDFDLTLAPPAELTNSIGMQLKLIPAGEFLMGSPAGEAERSNNEGPQHSVRITRPFYLGAYEVTVGQFRQFVEATNYRTEAEQDGAGGGGWTGKQWEWRKPEFTWGNIGIPQPDVYPVVNVSWNDAVAFCQWLSTKEGRAYRLPTEAEWEYACRGRTTTPFHWGTALNGKEANCPGDRPYGTTDKGPNLRRPTRVGSYAANAFGLYDMHGNVWEWCQDWYDGEYYAQSPPEDPPGPAVGSIRVLRGGCWFLSASLCRSAFRVWIVPGLRSLNLGFRVAAVPSGR
jgi:sulfatase modifying factor 1